MRNNFKDETGKIYGNLIVLEYVGYLTTKNYWKCECKCGNIKNISSTTLRSNKTVGCGCARFGRKSDYIEAVYKKHYTSLKMNSKKHSVPINEIINYVQWRKLVDKNCTYCGQIPYNIHYSYNHGHRRKNNKDIISAVFNGVDRVNSNIGYLEDNCVSCCTSCNRMKMELDKDYFLDMVKKIYINLIKK